VWGQLHPPTFRGTWGNFGETTSEWGKLKKWRAGAQKRQYL